ncbi:MAG: Asp-tRNA(Asn)/Glu-tRNA(Gln) amidotransferase subunit GatB [Dehalococcoidales bacterium]|nr:Asp-tRNA(Asn)/Glu-tRNA(Gln) amidotransferase subunit GatB [Dehalococcoidales bacterium]
MSNTTTAIKYETVIGLEVHVQLNTKSKMFCACSADYANTPPNTHVCPVCLGMPGVLPVINKHAVEYTIMTALALHCPISEYTKFDRKNYPYPDLMKGYQISQFDAPIGQKGTLTIEVDGQKKQIGITRVHLEEDVAKLIHRLSFDGKGYSLMDVNRSGVPLMEIVGEPDLRSPEEARQYLMKLHSILQYIGVSTANMEEGSFRCDANISIRPEGSDKLLAKVEVKNMNSFRAVFRALEYEAQRQRKATEEGKRLVQETRGWVEEEGKTVSQRSKEFAHDYRYFPEPDLPPLFVSRQWVEEIKARLPELPEARRDRFISEFGLPLYDANLLTSSKAMAEYFEACLKTGLPGDLPLINRAKLVSNWLLGEFSRLLNATNSEIRQAKVNPEQLSRLIDLTNRGTLNGPAAKQVFEEMFNTGKPASEVVAQKGLSQISDSSELEKMAEKIIAENPQAVIDFKAGKETALKFLVGQLMKATRGRANPQMANQLLKNKLGEK